MAFTDFNCPQISASLMDYFSENCMEFVPLGTLDAILSDVNRANLKKIPYDQGNGHYRTVELGFIPKLNADDTEVTPQNICTIGDDQPPQSMFVNVTNFISSKAMPVSLAEVAKLCIDFDYRNKLFTKMLDQVNESLDIKLLTDISTNFGDYYDSADVTRDYDMLKSDGSANLPGLVQFIQDYQQIGCSEKPIIVGDKKIDMLFLLGKYGCCNTTQGIDVARTSEFAYYYRDNQASNILGTDNFAAWDPGTIQLVTYNLYMGDNVINQDSMKFGTIIDPRTGLRWDLKMELITCVAGAPTWNIILELNYELVFLPTSIYPAGSPSEGVTGVLNGVALQLP